VGGEKIKKKTDAGGRDIEFRYKLFLNQGDGFCKSQEKGGGGRRMMGGKGVGLEKGGMETREGMPSAISEGGYSGFQKYLKLANITPRGKKGCSGKKRGGR